jgi:hypothetical protein
MPAERPALFVSRNVVFGPSGEVCQIAEEPKSVLINTASKQQFTYKDACVEHDPHVNHDAEATRAATSAVEGLLKAAFKLE